VKVLDFENFDADVFLKHPLVVILAATHYEGYPTDNSEEVL